MQIPTDAEDGLRRDVAVLSTLAHLHYGTIQQLHALCFPKYALATTRVSLHYLAAAGFVAHSTWRSRRGSYIPGPEMAGERGQVWTLTAKGWHLLQQYAVTVPPLTPVDLARPSTALEHEEWRVRLDVRFLLVRLVLEARERALLNDVEIILPDGTGWPEAWQYAPCPPPDALLSVRWSPVVCQPPDWLPWIGPVTVLTNQIRYPIYLERSLSRRSITEVVCAWSQASTTHPFIPIVILRTEDRLVSTYQHAEALPQSPPLRMTTWNALETGVLHGQWRDEHGRICGLHPLPVLESVVR